jgi:pseudouridine synthase
MEIRLQKIIADAGLASRREAERWIEDGKVSVNGKLVRELGTTADPENDCIKVKGKVLPKPQEKVWVLFNKPKGCVTTVKDDQNRKTVMDYFKKFPVRLFPVGRLDFNTEGLLLMTNDGALAKKLLDPASGVRRTYRVKVHGIPDEKSLRRLRRGVVLDNRKSAPIEVEVERSTGRNSYLILGLVEGKYRHIRRACELIGHPVVKLARTGFGNLTLSRLPLGTFRFLSDKEVRGLKKLVQAPAKSSAA